MTETSDDKTSGLVDHFFRNEYGKLVATLGRACGVKQFELVEDMVQASLLEALRHWRIRGIPDNPQAWIYQVAKNKLLDSIRHQKVELKLAPNWLTLRQRPEYATLLVDELFLDSNISDSQLRLIFACCHPQLNQTDQIALTLRTLCGFDSIEISRALLLKPETARKRITRAKQRLIDSEISLSVPPLEELQERLDVVHQVLYLIFNEGYFSSQADSPIRDDVCEEAARLCFLLVEHPQCSTPTTCALLALMLFQAARRNARVDPMGIALQLDEQDRGMWDERMIRKAHDFLARAAVGSEFSRYHLEAGIAMHHSTAVSFEQTNWLAIRQLYDVLIAKFPSPIYELNRAVIVAQLEGPKAGLKLIEQIKCEPSFERYFWLHTVSAELHLQSRAIEQAQAGFEAALVLATSPSEIAFIRRKIDSLK